MKVNKVLDTEYHPNDNEEFMNDRQVEYFQKKLLDWKSAILADGRDTIEGMQEGTRNIPDVADRASEETDRALELRTRDRQRKLVSKIDSALRRIEDGSYGWARLEMKCLSDVHCCIAANRLLAASFEGSRSRVNSRLFIM